MWFETIFSHFKRVYLLVPLNTIDQMLISSLLSYSVSVNSIELLNQINEFINMDTTFIYFYLDEINSFLLK